MKDTIAQATVAGIVGAAILNVIFYIFSTLRIIPITPWEVASDIFLVETAVHTSFGFLVGIIATAALGISSALLTLVIMKWTGFDHAVLKGILATDAIGFGGMGLFMPLLKIDPQIQKQAMTSLLAFIGLSLIGGIMGYLLLWINRKVGNIPGNRE